MDLLNVVVGILTNDKNEVLIALRPPTVVQPGIWEFPGGKVDPGETLEQALIREYLEEIGIEITRVKSFLKTEKTYLDYRLILHTFQILEYSGTPRGCENQKIRWVSPETLDQYTFPDANAEIVCAIQASSWA